MAPKVKVTKEDIANAAFALVCEQGIGALTAKSLAKKLGCSTQPIFWWYSNMQEVTDGVTARAEELFTSYLRREVEGVNAFKAIGLNHIAFAAENKNLFKMLFMSERVKGSDILGMDKNIPFVIKAVVEENGIAVEDAERVCREMWLFSHGIATMIATDTADFDDKAIGAMLTDVYKGVIGNITKKINNA